MADLEFFLDSEWEMGSVPTSRRPIIEEEDILEFKKTGSNHADLYVYEGGTGRLILPGAIRFTLKDGYLSAEDYGRKITIRQKGAAKRIEYEAFFLSGSGNQPDEGGDGDPK